LIVYKLDMMTLSVASCISLHTSHPGLLVDLSTCHINARRLYVFAQIWNRTEQN